MSASNARLNELGGGLNRVPALRRAWKLALSALILGLPSAASAQPTPDPMLAPPNFQASPALQPTPIQAIPGPQYVPDAGDPASTPVLQAAPRGAFAGSGSNQMPTLRPFAPVGPFDPRPPVDSRITGLPTNSQKLEVINHRSQLVITKDSVTRVAWSDPSVIDIVQFSDKEFSILGSKLGTTDLWLWFKDQPEPLMYTVNVVRDPSLEDRRRVDYGRIERKLALLYPNSKVYLIPLTYKIIVRGQARDPQEAANIMNIVRGEVLAEEARFGMGLGFGFGNGDVGGGGAGGVGNGFDNTNGFGRGNGDQNGFIVNELQVPGEFSVMVRVRIAEIRRSQLRRWGMNVNVLFNDARHVITSGLGAVPILSGVFENGEISVLIDALNQNGSARVLEDATLTTLSGESAAFLSGGEFAVPTTILGGGAVGAATTTFRGFGTSVIATPTVVDNDLIRIQIIPELSSINSGNAVGGVPGLNIRRIQTRVELREGQTIVLGGLFSRQERSENNRIPLLGELPGIGSYLFNAKRATEDEIELVIIVTPEIVRAMDADQVPPLPAFNTTHPDDIDFCRFNRIEGQPDNSSYQLLPYGNGNGMGQNVGYNFYQPNPASGELSPTANGGMAPAPGPYGGAQGQPAYGAPMQAPYGGNPGYAPNYGPGQYGPAPPPAYGPQPTPAMPVSQGNGRSISPVSQVQPVSHGQYGPANGSVRPASGQRPGGR
jgi:pilus assembly protein CpaC